MPYTPTLIKNTSHQDPNNASFHHRVTSCTNIPIEPYRPTLPTQSEYMLQKKDKNLQTTSYLNTFIYLSPCTPDPLYTPHPSIWCTRFPYQTLTINLLSSSVSDTQFFSLSLVSSSQSWVLTSPNYTIQFLTISMQN